jgi:hypothetical protein
VLETEGVRFAPDVVIVTVFLGNDLFDLRMQRHFDWPKPYFVLRGAELGLVPPRRTWDVVLRESSYLGELSFRILGRGLERNLVAPELAQADTVPLLARILQRMQASAAHAGATLLCVLIYPRERAEAEPIELEVRTRDALRGAQLTVLDLHRVFVERTAAGDDLFVADGHWNSAGHALAAREIAAELTARGW